MTSHLKIDARLGDIILRSIELENDGQRVHIVVIAMPLNEGGILGEPSFLTSLQPDDMQEVVKQIGEGFERVKHTRRLMGRYEP